ncbi:MAG: RloB domain-containing protein [Filimonas sp.]|nr:RloB domain-containing protein [Filimonas sp.]
MARKVKISNEIKKRFARQEHKRAKNVREKRKYYLIVCEGKATEPNYFEGLKRDLPKGVLTACQIDIEGAGMNTQSLVDEALRLKEKYERLNSRPVDRLWVVFDRDSFSAENFNAAITRCANNKPAIGCAWSNEAFELWYLLHFQYYENHMQRGGFKNLIEGNVRPFAGKQYEYLKNDEEMYALLKTHGNPAAAIANAKRLAARFAGRHDYANQNPCTMVHLLIEELLALK